MYIYNLLIIVTLYCVYNLYRYIQFTYLLYLLFIVCALLKFNLLKSRDLLFFFCTSISCMYHALGRFSKTRCIYLKHMYLSAAHQVSNASIIYIFPYLYLLTHLYLLIYLYLPFSIHLWGFFFFGYLPVLGSVRYCEKKIDKYTVN